MRNKKDSVKVQQWQKILQQWQQSETSQAEFCRQNRLNINTFAWWKIALLGKGVFSGAKKHSCPVEKSTLARCKKAGSGETSPEKGKPKQKQGKFLPVVVTGDSGKSNHQHSEAKRQILVAPWEKVAAEISSQDGANRIRIFDGTSAETIAAIVGACFR